MLRAFSFASPFRTLAVIAVLAFGAAATAAPTIALHPLVIVGGEGNEATAYGKLLDDALAQRGIHPAHPERVRDFLARSTQGACHDDACLAALARAAQADRTLYVTLSPYSPRLIVSARLIGASGREIALVAGREFVKGGQPLPRVIRKALGEVFSSFPFDAPEPPPALANSSTPTKPPASAESADSPDAHQAAPPVHPALAPKPIAPPAAPASTTAAPAVETHPTLRLASYVTAGAGALALVGAVTVALMSRTDRAKLEQLQDSSGNLPPTQEVFQIHDQLAARTHLTNALLISGGAALAAGATLFWLSRPSQRPRLSLAVGPSGAFASVQGHF